MRALMRLLLCVLVALLIVRWASGCSSPTTAPIYGVGDRVMADTDFNTRQIGLISGITTDRLGEWWYLVKVKDEAVWLTGDKLRILFPMAWGEVCCGKGQIPIAYPDGPETYTPVPMPSSRLLPTPAQEPKQ